VKTKIVLFYVLFLFGISRANDLTGTITDAQTGAPLPGVHISIAGTKYGAASEPDGSFTIKNLTPGEYLINIHLIGYKKAPEKSLYPNQEKRR